MNRRDLEDVLTNTRNELRESFSLPQFERPDPASISPLQSIADRIQAHIVRYEGVHMAYEICYRHVFVMHDWPQWCAAPIDERVEWIKDNLSIHGFDPEVPNLIGISDDIEATSFKTVWR